MLANAQFLPQLIALSTSGLFVGAGLAMVGLSALGVLAMATFEIRNVAEAHRAPRKLLGASGRTSG